MTMFYFYRDRVLYFHSSLFYKLIEMEPLMVLSSSVSETDLKKCILCQTTDTREKLSESTSSGSSALISAVNERKSFSDVKSADKIERILSTQHYEYYHYHRTCYQNFTNKTNIERLKSKNSIEIPNDSNWLKLYVQNTSRTSRSNPDAKTDKMLCILCQV